MGNNDNNGNDGYALSLGDLFEAEREHQEADWEGQADAVQFSAVRSDMHFDGDCI